MPRLYRARQQVSNSGGNLGLAAIFEPGEYGGYINVTKDFPWTVSQNAKSNAGRVILKEYEVNETTIKRQMAFYSEGLRQFGNGLTRPPSNTPFPIPNRPSGFDSDIVNSNYLSPYQQLYPKDKPTRFWYDFPYFDEINFDVRTPQWASLDTLEQVASQVGIAAKQGAGELQKAFKDVLPDGADRFVDIISSGAGALMNVATQGAGAALGFAYPKVGITDRPRLWERHDYREIYIKVPLYNTLDSEDWKLNRQLCELLVNQNLYNKRDFITGIPPVFYEVLVIGQHFSWASCVTNITVYNRGNIRLLYDKDRDLKCNVPDVYEINMTLTDLVVPSKNQFQAVFDSRVAASITSNVPLGDPTPSGAFGVPFNTLQAGAEGFLQSITPDLQRGTIPVPQSNPNTTPSPTPTPIPVQRQPGP